MNDEIIKIIIADDHSVYRSGLRMLLATYKNISVISEAENGRQLIDLCIQYKPDVVLTDLVMPFVDGVQAIKELYKLGFQKIIALSTFDTEYLIKDALEAGISGYVLKNAQKGEIIEAINRVYSGGKYFCPSITASMFRIVQDSKLNPERRARIERFSERERDIIKLICEEKLSDEIAKILFLSKRNVDSIRAKILAKMNVKTTAGLALYAVKNSLYQIQNDQEKKISCPICSKANILK